MIKPLDTPEAIKEYQKAHPCPERATRTSPVYCKVTEDICYLERGGQCELYDDFLFEERQKELDKRGMWE